MTHTKIMKFVQ